MSFTQAQLLALLPILIVGATALAVMTAIAVGRHHRVAATIAVAGLNLALIACLLVPQLGPQQVTPLLRVDGYACFYMALILITTLATATLSHAYLEADRRNPEEFYLLLVIAAMGGLVMVCAEHLATLFIGVELLSIPLYGMIGYPIGERRSLEASLKYLVLSASASAFLLFGLALIYAQTGALGYAELGAATSQLSADSPYLLVGGAMLLVGLGFKLSLVPFHLWTPDVFEGAPAPTMLFLATASKVAVFAALTRYFAEAGDYHFDRLLDVLSGIAILSILVGSLLALMQKNLKRLMAYSSITHFGYCLVALIAGGELAVEAVGVYLLTYVVTALGAFGVISLMSSPHHERDADSIHDYRGLFWDRPYLTSTMIVAMFSLAGVPLTAGFIGKFYVLAAGIDARLWWLVGTVVLGSAIGLYYYLRVIIAMFLTERGIHRTTAPLDWAQRAGGIVILLITVLMFWLGVYPQPLIELIRAAGLH